MITGKSEKDWNRCKLSGCFWYLPGNDGMMHCLYDGDGCVYDEDDKK